MSDWKARAKKVEAAPPAQWKSRAVPTQLLPLDKSDEMYPQSAPDDSDARTMSRISMLAQGGTGGLQDELLGVGAGLRAATDRGMEALGFKDPEPYVSDAIDQPGVTIGGRVLSHGKHIPETGRAQAPGFMDAYRDTRDTARGINRAEKDAEPYLSSGLELAGAMALPTPKTGKIVKGTPLVKLALKYAKAGLPIGALMGFGASDADLTDGDIGGAALDTAIGGGTGAVVGGVVGAALEKGGLKMADVLREKAKANALKAAGARGGIANAMQKMGYETADEAKELGGEALDSGLIPFMGDKDAVWKRAVEKEGHVGPAIGAMFDAADTAGEVLADGQTIMAPSFDFSRAKAAAAKGLKGINAVAKGNAGKATGLLDQIGEQGSINSTFKAAKELGTSAGRSVNHAVETPEAAALHKKIYNLFKNDRMEQLEAVLGPDEVDTLRSLNKVYSTAKKVRKLSSNASTRDAVNRGMGLIGSLQGQTLATALPEAAAPMGLVWPKIENFLTQRVPAGMAVTQNGASNATKALMASKYAPTLMAAAAKGSAALAVAHYVLNQRDPEYRALLEGGAPQDRR